MTILKSRARRKQSINSVLFKLKSSSVIPEIMAQTFEKVLSSNKKILGALASQEKLFSVHKDLSDYSQKIFQKYKASKVFIASKKKIFSMGKAFDVNDELYMEGSEVEFDYNGSTQKGKVLRFKDDGNVEIKFGPAVTDVVVVPDDTVEVLNSKTYLLKKEVESIKSELLKSYTENGALKSDRVLLQSAYTQLKQKIDTQVPVMKPDSNFNENVARLGKINI